MSQCTYWYVDTCGDPTTNKLLSETLPEDCVCYDQPCADGKRRDLWSCNHSTITRLEHARTQLHLRFRVFKKEGRYGKIKSWRFENKPVKILSKEESMELHSHHHD